MFVKRYAMRDIYIVRTMNILRKDKCLCYYYKIEGPVKR